MGERFNTQRCLCPACLPGGTGEVRIVGGRTPWAVRCSRHGRVCLSHHEYMEQLKASDSRWVCLLCAQAAPSLAPVVEWDLDNQIDYEQWVEEQANAGEREAFRAAYNKEGR